MALKIEKRLREVPRVGVPPYRQIHAHSTGNPRSTAQNEADYYHRKDPVLGTFSHIVGNGRIIQVSPVNRGFWDVGGGWNYEAYAAVELLESHKSREEFMVDYKLYINLLRELAKEAGIPTTLDKGSVGILSHEYCTYNQPNNYSDHVDPYPYLARWGISREQFAKDLNTGFGDDSKTKAAAQKLIEETEEDEMLLVSCKEDSKLGMILVVGGKAVGIPEDNGNVQAFLGVGAKPAHVTKAMYQQIEKKLM